MYHIFWVPHPQYEPRHDKTNKMSVCPAKTQISLGIRPVDQSLRCALNGKLRTQGFFVQTANTLIRLGGCSGWSESSLDAHSLCWFCRVVAHMSYLITTHLRKFYFSYNITVYTQYFCTKKPLCGHSAHYMNIGAQVREWVWLQRYLADVLSTCPSSAEDNRKWHRSNMCRIYKSGCTIVFNIP